MLLQRALSIACILSAVCCTAQTSVKKNVIIIVADDLGYNDAGYLNPSTYYLTPAIDSLAARSLRLNNFHSMPTCSPTRASLMTGQYPTRHGIYAVDAFAHTPTSMRKVLGGASKKQLDKETFTLPVLFREAGYHTALIGKWHLGNNPLQYRGQPVFDTVIGRAYPNEGHPLSYFYPYGNIEFPVDAAAPTYLTDRLTYEACRFIKANRSEPFFLYLAHYAPHVPLNAKKEDADRMKGRTNFYLQNRPVYGGMLLAEDRSVAAIMQLLKEEDLLKNTLVVFLSDNGGQLMSTDNTPLRGQKGELYEGGVRVPALLWFQGIQPEDNEDLCSVVDVLPTVAEWSGLTLPKNHAFDGMSLVELPKHPDWSKRAIFFHVPGYTGNGNSNALVWQPPASAILCGQWKLIQSLEDDQNTLYNLANDPGEQKDVGAQHPALVSSLLKQLKQWQRTTRAVMPSGVNPAFVKESRNWTDSANTRLPNDNTNIEIR